MDNKINQTFNTINHDDKFLELQRQYLYIGKNLPIFYYTKKLNSSQFIDQIQCLIDLVMTTDKDET